MTFFRQVQTVGAAIGGIILLGALSIQAQEPSAKSSVEKPDPPATKRTFDPARRVPSHFGQLGLTQDQKESIYKIRATHLPEIDALQKKIADLQAKMIAECEGILTEAQRELLVKRRSTATEKRKGAQTAKSDQEPPKSSN